MLQDACSRLATGDPRCVCIMSAVFYHDSKWATANNPDGSPSVGKRMLNPGNLRCLSTDSPFEHECVDTKVNGYFAKFKDLQTGIDANVDLYARLYRGLPWDKLASQWAQTPVNPPSQYARSIKKCYPEIANQ